MQLQLASGRIESALSGMIAPSWRAPMAPMARTNRFVTGATGKGQASEEDGKLLSLFSQSPLQFGPRLVAGALATVFEEGIAAPQKDLERLQLLASSDMDNKEQQILAEVEDRIAQFVSLGTEKESELIASLPLPDALRELLQAGEARAGPGVGNSGTGKPLASWTITDSTMDDGSMDDVDEYVTPELTASGQAASELNEIQEAVAVLRENLEALNMNTDESKVGMLRLNIRDAANTVKQKLDQQQMATNSADVDSALLEAKSLLTEVDTL